MACLCAPTTHEGSFRCRFHRAPTPADHHRHQPKIAFPGRHVGISDQTRRLRPRHCDSTSAHHQLRCDSRLSSASPSFLLSSSSSPPRPARASSSPSSASPPPPSPASHHCPRPPSGKRAGSLTPIPLSKSFQSRSAVLRLESGESNATHAAAIAIMKQHLQDKLHTRSSSSTIRSPAAFKVAPSRLRRMGSACAEEDPLLKTGHYYGLDSANDIPPLSPMSSSCNYGKPSANQLILIEATQASWRTHTTSNKLKLTKSSCKPIGLRVGHHIVSAIY